jgi:low molecular weight phosphotyrosine protein phosphatase
MAAGIARHLVAQRPDASDWQVESCGTGAWHIGDSADPRTIAVLKRHQVPLKHRARQLASSDFTSFDYLLCMDQQNVDDVRSRAPADSTATVALIGDWDPESVSEVGDPYYGGDSGFDRVYEQLDRSIRAFLDAHP